MTSAAYRALGLATLDAAGASLRPQHVFGALSRLEVSVGQRALECVGLSWRALGIPRLPPAPPVTVDPGLTPTSVRLLEAAAGVAARLGHHPINTGHVVLAILTEEAGPLATDSALTAAAYERALNDVLGRPDLHGYALDGETVFYLTRDESLVLYGALLKAQAWQRAHPAERIVLEGIRELLRPACEAVLEADHDLDRARRAVVRLRGAES